MWSCAHERELFFIVHASRPWNTCPRKHMAAEPLGLDRLPNSFQRAVFSFASFSDIDMRFCSFFGVYFPISLARAVVFELCLGREGSNKRPSPPHMSRVLAGDSMAKSPGIS